MSDTLPLFRRAQQHGEKVAIVDATGEYTYRQLMEASYRLAARLMFENGDLAERRVAFLVAPGYAYACAQWAIWRAGGVAVPLGASHPPPELEFVLDDTQAAAVIADDASIGLLRPLSQRRGLPLSKVDDDRSSNKLPRLPSLDSQRRAMILYTSGTTSKPKGVVTTHGNIQAQVESLVQAWQWSPDDRILHVLPLHHIHGIINALTCALWAGATCEMMPNFDAEKVWERISRGGLTLFMAVPTIYSKLISHWEQAPGQQQQAMSAGCLAMRLIVSGSAALPVSMLQRWLSVSGHTLLERYGMTEIGMALSNPLHGQRTPGCVGTPLPNVKVRRCDDQGFPAAPNVPAELQVRGPTVFLEYWNKPDATRAAFDNGWFLTGDVAVVENGNYRLLGRSSVDIIKSGGYKVSALEVEEVLREHPDIDECAVVGVDDHQWGQRVAACVVLRKGAPLQVGELRDWTKKYLAGYKSPTLMLAVDSLPRNAMGKVQKPAIAALFQSDQGYP